MNSNVLMQKLVFVALGRQSGGPLRAARPVGAVDRRHHRALVVLPPAARQLDALSDRLRKALGARRSRRGAQAARRPASRSRRRSSREALDWYDDGPEAVEQILAKATRLRRKSFEGGLLFLGTLGNNAPFIGLFGTVLGIVTAFRELGGQLDGRAWATSWAASPRR